MVFRAEKLLKPRRKGKTPRTERGRRGPRQTRCARGVRQESGATDGPVFVASDVDRTRRLYKALQKQATIVECWGLKGSKDARVDLRQVARQAEQMVQQAVADAGQRSIRRRRDSSPSALGPTSRRLRGDIERLLLYTAGKPQITVADAREVVSAEIAQDDWAVTNAIERGDTDEALRQLGLSLDSGAVPFMILGQLAYFVREKLRCANGGPAGRRIVVPDGSRLQEFRGGPESACLSGSLSSCVRPSAAESRDVCSVGGSLPGDEKNHGKRQGTEVTNGILQGLDNRIVMRLTAARPKPRSRNPKQEQGAQEPQGLRPAVQAGHVGSTDV